jgi:hypothetical protein
MHLEYQEIKLPFKSQCIFILTLQTVCDLRKMTNENKQCKQCTNMQNICYLLPILCQYEYTGLYNIHNYIYNLVFKFQNLFAFTTAKTYV